MEGKREVVKTEVGAEYQKELLTKEMKNLRKKLKEQLANVNNLTGTRDVSTIETEMEKVNILRTKMDTLAERLYPLLEEEAVQEMQEIVRNDKINVARVEEAVKEWLEALKDFDTNSMWSVNSKGSKEGLPTSSGSAEKMKENTEVTQHTEQDEAPDVESWPQVISKHGRLESQMSLIQDLLLGSDDKLLETELSTLGAMHAKFLAALERARGETDNTEYQKVEEITLEAAERVKALEYKARRRITELQEEERSARSHRTSKSVSSKISQVHKHKATLSQCRDIERTAFSETGGVKKARERKGASLSDSFHNLRSRSWKMTSNDDLRSMKERFRLEVKRMIKKVTSEIQLTSDLVEVGGRDILQRRLERLERLEEEIGSGFFQSSQLFLEEEKEEIERTTEELEEKLLQAKNCVVKALVSASKEEIRSIVSDRSGRSRKSKGSIEGKYEWRQTEDQNELIQVFNYVQKRFESQMKLILDVCEAEDSESAHKEILKAERMLQSMQDIAEKLSKVVPFSNVKYLLEVITKKEGKVAKCKRKMIKLATKAKEDNHSVTSCSTRKTHLTGVSSNSQLSEKKDVSNMCEMKVSQTECLKDEWAVWKVKLSEEKQICQMLESEENPYAAEKEIRKLEDTFNKMEKVAFRLREQLPSIEMDEVSKTLEREDNEVFEIKRKAIKRIADESKMKEDLLTRDNGNGKEGLCKKAGAAGSKRAESEAILMKSRLDNQMLIIDDLIKAKNWDLIDWEVQVLDKVYDSYVAVMAQLREKMTQEEAKELSKKIDEEDTRVFKKKELVAKLKSCAQEKKVDKKQELMDEKRDSATSRRIMHQYPPKEDSSSSVTRLTELMMQTMKLQAAPKVEIDVFYGDPLEYSYFLENFKDVVENLIDDPKQRLLRLLKFTDGEAKQLIKHCVHEQRETCYDTALSLLEQEYGSPQRISCAYHERLKSWPQIRTNDAAGIRSLHRFLLKCLSYQKSGKIDLNSPLTIREIQLSLPNNLQDKWVGRVGRIRKKRNREATFADFAEFVEEESHCLNDPVYARGVSRIEKKEDRKLCAATEMEENYEEDEKKGKNDEKATRTKCQVCTAHHDLDECQIFNAMTAREKKDLLFKAKMCFACYGSGHPAKQCKEKRVCRVCDKEHPTGLHDVTFKVSAVKQGESGMCIVPIRLKHASWEEKELEVYAMLDECIHA